MFEESFKNIRLQLVIVSTGALLASCAGGGGGHGGGGGGGGGGGVADNPVPTVSSLSPSSFTANAATSAGAQIMTVNGTNFVSGATVLWNGTALSGAAVNGNGAITVPVPASDLQVTGTATVVVSNPAPGGGNSNPVVLNIEPEPLLAAPTEFSPASTNALSGGFELGVTATNVLYNSVVVWDVGTPGQTVLNTQLTTPPASSGGPGTLTAVVPNRLISSAGAVAVAVATPNPDGSLTMVSPSMNFSINPMTAPACLLAGVGAGAPQYRNYAFQATGADNNGAMSMVGSLRIDASGSLVNSPAPNVVNSLTDFKDAKNLFAVTNAGATGRMSGGAASCVDRAGVPGVGKVVFTVNSIPGDTFTLNYTLRGAGDRGRITLTDTLYGVKATGQVQIQYFANAFNVGSFAFGLLGENASAARYAVVGAMCTSSPVFLQADFADDQTAGGTVTGTASAWSLSNGDATTGRVTTSPLNFSNGRSMNLTLYGVGGGKAYVMESSSIATSKQVLSGVMTGFKGQHCLASGRGGSFSNSSLGLSIFGASSQGGGAGLAVLGLVTGILPAGGGDCAAGQGHATLNEDVNANGTLETVPQTPACYSVTPAGRAVLSFTDPNSKKLAGGTFYLDGTGGGYLVGGGSAIAFGFVQPVASPAPPSGVYSFAPFDFPGGLLDVTSVALNVPPAASGSLADNSPGGSSGTFGCCDSLDRGAATLDNVNTFGDTQVIFYEAQTNQIYFMGASSAAPAIGVLMR